MLAFKVEAHNMDWHSLYRAEVNGAHAALTEYRHCMAIPDVQYVTVCIAILHKRYNEHYLESRVQPLQYGYNGLGQIGHWRQIKHYASEEFAAKWRLGHAL